MTLDPSIRTVSRRDELLEVVGADPFVQWRSPAVLEVPAYAADRVVAIPGTRSHFVVPAPDARQDDVTAMLRFVRQVVLAGQDEGGVSVPQRFAHLRDNLFRTTTGGDWDWMWTTDSPAPTPGEGDVIDLDDNADAEEIGAFMTTHNPRVWTEVGTGQVRTWVGVRGLDKELLAVGGAQAEASGVAHLAGILTHPNHRGRGLARAVSAVLTRRAVVERGVCTLGMYSDNDPARAVYRGLGYRTAHAWSSRRVTMSDASHALE